MTAVTFKSAQFQSLSKFIDDFENPVFSSGEKTEPEVGSDCVITLL